MAAGGLIGHRGIFRHSLPLCALALSFSLAGGGDEPDVFACLHDSTACSFGPLGGECPPAASDWSTQCIVGYCE